MKQRGHSNNMNKNRALVAHPPCFNLDPLLHSHDVQMSLTPIYTISHRNWACFFIFSQRSTEGK